MIIVHKSRLQLSNELRYNQRRTTLLNATDTGLGSITKCAETKTETSAEFRGLTGECRKT